VKATDKIGSSNNSRQWLAHVEAQQKSGLSRTEYCKQYNLSYQRNDVSDSQSPLLSGNKTLWFQYRLKAFRCRISLVVRPQHCV